MQFRSCLGQDVLKPALTHWHLHFHLSLSHPRTHMHTHMCSHPFSPLSLLKMVVLQHVLMNTKHVKKWFFLENFLGMAFMPMEYGYDLKSKEYNYHGHKIVFSPKVAQVCGCGISLINLTQFHCRPLSWIIVCYTNSVQISVNCLTMHKLLNVCPKNQ